MPLNLTSQQNNSIEMYILKKVLGTGSTVLKASSINKQVQAASAELFHSCPVMSKSMRPHKQPCQWLTYNDIVYPPQLPAEERRPAEIVHQRANIKYSQKKLYYIAYLIRGMSIDEAVKQLSLHKQKGADIVKDVLEEARQLAVQKHNVEFRSNLWVETAFIGKAKTIKGFRKHARRSPGTVHYRYTHFFLRLREGTPPKHYYPPAATGHQLMQIHLDELKDRTILNSL